MGIRPKTLLLAFTPITLGTVLALPLVQQVNWLTFFSALMTAFSVQAGANLVNDALDFKKGADTAARAGPKRVTPLGIYSPKEVLRAGLAAFLLAFGCGIPLIAIGGWPAACFIGIAVLSGYAYTGGPRPLAYRGGSEFFILAFFGIGAVNAAYFFQVGHFALEPLIAGIQLGFLAIVPLAINNLRDIKEDKKADKKTLAVRFGKTFALWETGCCLLAPFFIGIYWLLNGKILSFWLPLMGAPLSCLILISLFYVLSDQDYNQFIFLSILLQFFFAFLIALSVFL